jgi:oxygen-dependent protoporphyrinogen oxidase
MSTVAILGAGITGLTAAWHLQKAGIPFALYEASARTGGVICSRRDGPWLAEGGPNTILETSLRVKEYVEALGLAERRQYSDPAASARFIARNGKPLQLPGSGPEFFLKPAFSVGAKLRLLREPFIGRADHEESVAEFVFRRLGQEFLDYAIDPLVTGIYAGDPAKLSIRHAFPKIHALEAKYGSLIRGQILGARERKRRGEVSKATARKFSFDNGLQVLPDTAFAAVRTQVHLETRVEGLSRQADGWRLTLRHRDAISHADHRIVLLCGNAHTLARLQLNGPNLPSLAPLAEIQHPPVTSVVLGFRRSEVAHPCLGFGLLIPHKERFNSLGTLFSSALFPGRAPSDHVTLTTYVGGVRNPDAAALADGPLVDSVVRDLDRLFGISGRPVFTAITRWPRAIPQYDVGYGRFKALLDDLEIRGPGLFTAGHYRDGVALSDSILTGIRAADRIRDFLASPAPSPKPAPAHS